jgi:anthranilate synthase component 1
MAPGLNRAPADLESLARDGPAAVLSREIAGDLLTPVGAFLTAFRTTPHAFLLESVEGGTLQARYSFLGGGPRRLFRIRDGRPTLEGDGGPERPLPGDPLAALRAVWSATRTVPQAALPRLRGGLVGFFSYDLARSLERLPGTPRDDRRIPDAVLGDYETVLAFDHLRHRIVLMSRLDLRGSEADRRRSFAVAEERLEALAVRLRDGAPGGPVPPRGGKAGEVVAEPDAAAFEAAVLEAKRSITAGEIFQIVLSRRFHVPWSGDPIAVYRALRSLNPSPYHFYLACGGDYLAGASPEMLVRVEGESVTCRPIAGTRPRGADEDADRTLEREMLVDPKERAEHVMLVDLARNDLGRISRPGSIEVAGMASVERFSHVMHLVSTVRGRLAPGRDALDALAACFPAGTLTGAPKVRAMQLIDAMEPFRRGAYGGAVAYLDAGGDLDSCITIRTIVLSGGKAFAQAGAGIVADSDPASERREIDHKAGALLQALEIAGRAEG